ncbi:uncharacterized protein LOC124667887 [Lolium rigidum]|uniref:uncharacterized protein LOC124667518 n=1 Tax=Lolium rigidum TaxID=89674 RepID=UPI001F5C8F89|nr:uncharacterized protein LOC124667518 [Lolium rigidum]XP_047061078.1 uncharacterized protein LOC124667887 [Lolium rigidum]
MLCVLVHVQSHRFVHTQQAMTEQEARQILGISEDEMGRDHEGELAAPQLSPHLTNCFFYVRDPSALDQNAMSNICTGSVTFREVHLRLKARTIRRSTPRVTTREKIQQQLWQLLVCHV